MSRWRLRLAALLVVALGLGVLFAHRDDLVSAVEWSRLRKTELNQQARAQARFVPSPGFEGAKLRLRGADAAAVALDLLQARQPDFVSHPQEEFDESGGDLRCARIPGSTPRYSCEVNFFPDEGAFTPSLPDGNRVYRASMLNIENLSIRRQVLSFDFFAVPDEATALAEFCNDHHGRWTGAHSTATCTLREGRWSGHVRADLTARPPRGVQPLKNEGSTAPCRLGWPHEDEPIATRRFTEESTCLAWCERALDPFCQNNPEQARDSWLIQCLWQGKVLPLTNPASPPQETTVVELASPLLFPEAFTVRQPSTVRLRLRFAPADYDGPFELVVVGPTHSRAVEPLSIPRLTQRNRGPVRELMVARELVFDTVGQHRLSLRARGNGGWVDSESKTIDVFPPGVPTSSGPVSMVNVVLWHGHEVLSNRLHVQLRSKKDFKLARRLAHSVGMELVGYSALTEYWEFEAQGKGSAEGLERAQRALSAVREVLVVEPEHVLRGK